SQTMTPLVIPLLVQQFVGEQNKGAYFGQLRLWTLMTALLVQALIGTVSDRSTHPWGKRRPFILAGTMGVVVVLVLVGFVAGLEGMSGYWALFTLVILQMVFANTAHGALQGLIPDLAPDQLRGRFSSIKAVLEIPLPVILVSFTIARLISASNLWGGLMVLIVILLLVMAATMFVKETPQKQAPFQAPWDNYLRLVLMTAAFTLVILTLGRLIHLTDFTSARLSSMQLIIFTGALGLIAMTLAVALGVWVSVNIAAGMDARCLPSFTWWVTHRLAYLVGSTNLASFAVYFLQGRFGLQGVKAAAPAAMLTMFVGVFLLVSAVPSGWLSDRFGKKPLLAISGMGACLGTLVVISAPTLTLVYAGGALIGAATGLFYTANWALGTELVPKSQAGRFLGISNLAGAGAGAVGAYIGGPIADYITLQTPGFPGMGYLVLFVIYGLMFLLSAVALIGVKQKGTSAD
ncbi:MAG: MFS transporter, partial [Anaerolineaceae bacterium]|nr:MFS transporter [Anaerolineaceae bacterium]